LLISILSSVALARSPSTEPTPAFPRATAVLEGRSGSQTVGLVTFTESGDAEAGATTLHVTLMLVDATPGNHALFLHTRGDCTSPDASSVGPTFAALPPPTEDPSEGAATRPLEATAGAPPTSGPPPGYIGFVTVSPDGRGEKELLLPGYTLTAGPRSIVDRSIVLYERAPDFTATADAGARQACGHIRTRPPPGTL
jgi:Cu/Zn superoxide dismutase